MFSGVVTQLKVLAQNSLPQWMNLATDDPFDRTNISQSESSDDPDSELFHSTCTLQSYAANVVKSSRVHAATHDRLPPLSRSAATTCLSLFETISATLIMRPSDMSNALSENPTLPTDIALLTIAASLSQPGSSLFDSGLLLLHDLAASGVIPLVHVRQFGLAIADVVARAPHSHALRVRAVVTLLLARCDATVAVVGTALCAASGAPNATADAYATAAAAREAGVGGDADFAGIYAAVVSHSIRSAIAGCDAAVGSIVADAAATARTRAPDHDGCSARRCLSACVLAAQLARDAGAFACTLARRLGGPEAAITALVAGSALAAAPAVGALLDPFGWCQRVGAHAEGGVGLDATAVSGAADGMDGDMLVTPGTPARVVDRGVMLEASRWAALVVGLTWDWQHTAIRGDTPWVSTAVADTLPSAAAAAAYADGLRLLPSLARYAALAGPDVAQSFGAPHPASTTASRGGYDDSAGESASQLPPPSPRGRARTPRPTPFPLLGPLPFMAATLSLHAVVAGAAHASAPQDAPPHEPHADDDADREHTPAPPRGATRPRRRRGRAVVGAVGVWDALAAALDGQATRAERVAALGRVGALAAGAVDCALELVSPAAVPDVGLLPQHGEATAAAAAAVAEVIASVITTTQSRRVPVRSGPAPFGSATAAATSGPGALAATRSAAAPQPRAARAPQSATPAAIAAAAARVRLALLLADVRAALPGGASDDTAGQRGGGRTADVGHSSGTASSASTVPQGSHPSLAFVPRAACAALCAPLRARALVGPTTDGDVAVTVRILHLGTIMVLGQLQDAATASPPVGLALAAAGTISTIAAALTRPHPRHPADAVWRGAPDPAGLVAVGLAAQTASARVRGASAPSRKRREERRADDAAARASPDGPPPIWHGREPALPAGTHTGAAAIRLLAALSAYLPSKQALAALVAAAVAPDDSEASHPPEYVVRGTAAFGLAACGDISMAATSSLLSLAVWMVAQRRPRRALHLTVGRDVVVPPPAVLAGTDAHLDVPTPYVQSPSAALLTPTPQGCPPFGPAARGESGEFSIVAYLQLVRVPTLPTPLVSFAVQQPQSGDLDTDSAIRVPPRPLLALLLHASADGDAVVSLAWSHRGTAVRSASPGRSPLDFPSPSTPTALARSASPTAPGARAPPPRIMSFSDAPIPTTDVSLGGVVLPAPYVHIAVVLACTPASAPVGVPMTPTAAGDVRSDAAVLPPLSPMSACSAVPTLYANLYVNGTLLQACPCPPAAAGVRLTDLRHSTLTVGGRVAARVGHVAVVEDALAPSVVGEWARTQRVPPGTTVTRWVAPLGAAATSAHPDAPGPLPEMVDLAVPDFPAGAGPCSGVAVGVLAPRPAARAGDAAGSLRDPPAAPGGRTRPAPPSLPTDGAPVLCALPALPSARCQLPYVIDSVDVTSALQAAPFDVIRTTTTLATLLAAAVLPPACAPSDSRAGDAAVPPARSAWAMPSCPWQFRQLSDMASALVFPQLLLTPDAFGGDAEGSRPRRAHEATVALASLAAIPLPQAVVDDVRALAAVGGRTPARVGPRHSASRSVRTRDASSTAGGRRDSRSASRDASSDDEAVRGPHSARAPVGAGLATEACVYLLLALAVAAARSTEASACATFAAGGDDRLRAALTACAPLLPFGGVRLALQLLSPFATPDGAPQCAANDAGGALPEAHDLHSPVDAVATCMAQPAPREGGDTRRPHTRLARLGCEAAIEALSRAMTPTERATALDATSASLRLDGALSLFARGPGVTDLLLLGLQHAAEGHNRRERADGRPHPAHECGEADVSPDSDVAGGAWGRAHGDDVSPAASVGQGGGQALYSARSLLDALVAFVVRLARTDRRAMRDALSFLVVATSAIPTAILTASAPGEPTTTLSPRSGMRRMLGAHFDVFELGRAALRAALVRVVADVAAAADDFLASFVVNGGYFVVATLLASADMSLVGVGLALLPRVLACPAVPMYIRHAHIEHNGPGVAFVSGCLAASVAATRRRGVVDGAARTAVGGSAIPVPEAIDVLCMNLFRLAVSAVPLPPVPQTHVDPPGSPSTDPLTCLRPRMSLASVASAPKPSPSVQNASASVLTYPHALPMLADVACAADLPPAEMVRVIRDVSQLLTHPAIHDLLNAVQYRFTQWLCQISNHPTYADVPDLQQACGVVLSKVVRVDLQRPPAVAALRSLVASVPSSKEGRRADTADSDIVTRPRHAATSGSGSASPQKASSHHSGVTARYTMPLGGLLAAVAGAVGDLRYPITAAVQENLGDVLRLTVLCVQNQVVPVPTAIELVSSVRKRMFVDGPIVGSAMRRSGIHDLCRVVIRAVVDAVGHLCPLCGASGDATGDVPTPSDGHFLGARPSDLSSRHADALAAAVAGDELALGVLIANATDALAGSPHDDKTCRHTLLRMVALYSRSQLASPQDGTSYETPAPIVRLAGLVDTALRSADGWDGQWRAAPNCLSDASVANIAGTWTAPGEGLVSARVAARDSVAACISALPPQRLAERSQYRFATPIATASAEHDEQLLASLRTAHNAYIAACFDRSRTRALEPSL